MRIGRFLSATTLIAACAAGSGQAHFIGVGGNNSIDGSLCVGNDCVAEESFGFDTLRLKENNLRFHFEDTSVSASYPRNDWRIKINASANGGNNFFEVEDTTAGRTVFKIEAGARTNALFVDSQGDLGLGTATPAVNIDIKEGDTPTLRLQQDTSNGFAPHTWDIAGNETNFFIRDVSSGSLLPFRIRPGAPTSSIEIEENGDVGIGTGAADGPLHVAGNADALNALVVMEAGDVGVGTDAPTAPLHVEREIGALTDLLRLANDEGVGIRLADLSATGESWAIQNNNGTLRILSPAVAGLEFELETNGNLEINGTLTENSDKNSKIAIEPVDTAEILEKVMTLPLSAWTYIHDAEDGTRHIGPMAQDFYALFGTGKDETGISTIDTSGVALAAIQALEAKNAAHAARNAEQAALIAELLARVQALETSVAQ